MSAWRTFAVCVTTLWHSAGTTGTFEWRLSGTCYIWYWRNALAADALYKDAPWIPVWLMDCRWQAEVAHIFRVFIVRNLRSHIGDHRQSMMMMMMMMMMTFWCFVQFWGYRLLNVYVKTNRHCNNICIDHSIISLFSWISNMNIQKS